MTAPLFDARRGEPLSVGELVARLRARLGIEFGDVRVAGEIGSLHRSRLGHWYFDLKDPDAQLRAVLFRASAARLAFEPEEGMQVVARGRLDVYPERGALQLVVEGLAPSGEGALRAAFEQMKRRLEAEGLFDPSHRRPLPLLPRRIGLITSAGGAALLDFVRALRRRDAGGEVLLFDARVQGDTAWRDVARGLRLLDGWPGVDVIVLARGGGSLEDLWTFNREELVRAVFAAETPVVSAVGHEADVVLTDLVADLRAATPTAAAEVVLPDGAALRARLADLRRRVVSRQADRLRELSWRLEALRTALVHPADRLTELARRLGELRGRLVRAARAGSERRGAGLELASGRLHALSPQAVLGRGFSIARRVADGGILRASGDVARGEDIRVDLARGGLRATVVETAEG